MTEIELLICVAVLAGIAASRLLKKQRRPNHGLPHLEQVMQGDADAAQLLDLADALAKSVIDRAKALGKPPLFITASGDLYDDFFPPREPRPGSTPEQYANAVLADCVRRYRDARAHRAVEIFHFPLYALCTGAGLAVSSFRRLGGSSRDMRDLAEFLAPPLDPGDWEQYRDYYLEVALLLDLPRARIDAYLAKRWEICSNRLKDAAPPLQ
ncbi:hypothetical protein KL86DPRO_11241 [uncultured delta proteobacterium]|uniref:Uncharacterized protein n=1 Tax=uncultured delta proteobacterium TaxID=34034 RepID=A0A212JDT5_9DELT|nr:hypothetical protein KL86DPRO_11241 [uncultured delta proteobacterium]